jgi:zinc protease
MLRAMSSFRLASTLLTVTVLASTVLGPGCHPTQPRFGSLQADDRRVQLSTKLQLFEVSNGLRVLLAPDPRTNLVTVDVRYRVGSGSDPEGLAGLAHLVEHVLFQVPSGSGGSTIWDRLSSIGLTFNAYTSHELTHYTATALAERVDALLELEAQRMEVSCERLDNAMFARERDVVLAEESERRTPLADIHAQLALEVWGDGHPYARSVGSREVARATKADVCKFISDHYVPSRAVMVVTGNFNAEALQPRIGRRFGPITRAGVVDKGVVGPALFDGEVTEHQAPIEHPMVKLYLPAPGWGAADEGVHDIVFAALARELDDLDSEHDWVLDASVDHVGQGWQRATEVTVTVDQAARLDDAVAEVFARGRDLFQDDDHDGTAGDKNDPDDFAVLRLVDAWRGQLKTATVLRFDAIAGRGDWLADYLTYTNHNGFGFTRLQRLDEVTAEALVAHVAGMFDRRISHVARILPNGERRPAAAELTTVGGRTYDLVPWRFPVDPAEAQRALSLPSTLKPPVIEDYGFKNGLRVLLHLDPTSPVLEARMVFPAGVVDDDPARPGVAALAARLLGNDYDADFDLSVVQRLRWAMGVGTQYWGAADDGATVFTSRGLAVFGDWHVWRLSWLLDQGIYDPEDLRGLRQDLRERGDGEASPSGLAFRERLFGRGHPYAARRATVAQLTAISGGQLAAWRNAHFGPSGATLIVSGGFDREAMHKVIAELFGAWPRRGAAARGPIPAPAPMPGPSWMGVREPSAAQVTLYVSMAARSTPADRAARMVLSEMLRDRLRIVREGMGASYGVSAGYDSGAAGTALDISTALDPVRAPEAAVAVMKELEALRRDAAGQAAAFARARRRVLAQMLATSRDAGTVADELEWLVRNQLGLDQLQGLTAAVASLTPATVAAVAAADLDPTRMVVSVDGPAEPVKATLTAIGARDPQWFDE